MGAAPVIGRGARRGVGERAYRREPDAKRERLLEAARGLFAERGYAGATTAGIAERAGVSEGILFHHFGSKRELFAELAGAYGRGLARAMFGDDPAASLATPEDALARAFAYARAHRDLHRVFLVRDPALAALAHDRTREQIVAALEGVLRAGAARGRVRPCEPRVTAELLYHLVGGALEACFGGGRRAREEDVLRETVRCVRGALAPLPEAPDAPHPPAPSGKPDTPDEEDCP